ncbi:hypothetical protein K435DRAFT_799183 [Dendrothele bispora CBS 962.96]|uniref:Uncharacterized protein n=1 Tax=Dendrothele bispora (strain CBS 962.96) TaxID=1314807 RepID=A0A4S8LXX4_DENBC|nr:hypothetical protein K435DRAFT_799183 [Dendrothele bispora CBS 962.96]
MFSLNQTQPSDEQTGNNPTQNNMFWSNGAGDNMSINNLGIHDSSSYPGFPNAANMTGAFLGHSYGIGGPISAVQSPFPNFANQNFSSPTHIGSLPSPNASIISTSTLEEDILTLKNSHMELKELADKHYSELTAAKETVEQQRSELEVTKNEVEALKAQILQLHQSTTSVAPSNRAGKSGSTRKTRNSALEKLIHMKAHAALGLKYQRGLTAILPGPLGPNDECRKDGERILYNPNWKNDHRDPVNTDFIDAVTIMVVNQVKVDETIDSLEAHEVRPSVKNYFDTLADNWKQQNDPKKKESALAHRSSNKGYMRRGRDVETLTRGLPRFIELYGTENCEGIRVLLDEAWMDTCFNEPGKEIPEVWQARADEVANGSKAWEVRQQAWQAKNLRRIICRLFKLGREGLPTSGNNAPTPRFHCSVVNIEKGYPQKNRPWRSFVRESWLEANPEFTPLDDDPTCTILSLEIPDTDFDATELKWLADDEVCAEAAMKENNDTDQ